MQFFYTLNSIYFFRLFFLFRDKPVNLKSTLILTLLQILPLLLFDISFQLFTFIVLLFVINLLQYFLEKTGEVNFYRFISFVCLFILTFIFSSGSFGLEFNVATFQLFKRLNVLVPPIFIKTKINFTQLNIILFGSLILVNEVNFLIRYFFEFLNLYPVNAGEEKKIDEKEYNAGRVIGMLERILIFLFVLLGEITVIGFIIAAKGFTRFKELDKRDFAEYVLIGTLLSSFLALIVSFLTKYILTL